MSRATIARTRRATRRAARRERQRRTTAARNRYVGLAARLDRQAKPDPATPDPANDPAKPDPASAPAGEPVSEPAAVEHATTVEQREGGHVAVCVCGWVQPNATPHSRVAKGAGTRHVNQETAKRQAAQEAAR